MYNERHVGSQAIRFLPQLMELCVWVGGLTIVWMAAEIHHQCKCTFEVEEIEEENIMIIIMMMQNIFYRVLYLEVFLMVHLITFYISNQINLFINSNFPIKFHVIIAVIRFKIVILRNTKNRK